jgi:aspartate-semialdehyde dehydrogenase
MATAGVRVAVVGATGAVGTALLEALEASPIRVAQLVAVAGDRSLGADVEFAGDVVPVAPAVASWPGLDAIFLCAPPEVSREVARDALRAEVPVIDLSGAFADAAEVPVRVAGWVPPGAPPAPLVAAPPAPTLACALALHPLARAAGLARVEVTLFDSAAVGGQRGSERLAEESLAIFNQQEPAESDVFEHPVAFDCGPGGAAARARERHTQHLLERVLGSGVEVFVAAFQVPAFVGQGCALRVETGRPLPAAEAARALSKAPGVELWPAAQPGPSLRSATGREELLVAVPREIGGGALALWAVCDGPGLAARNAVALAEPRLARPA